MTQPLVTAEQRAQLLAVGAALAADRGIDPMPVVRLFTPDAHHLAAGRARPGRWRYGLGLIDLGIACPAWASCPIWRPSSPRQQPVMRDRYFQPVRLLSEYLRLAEENGSITD